MEGKNMRFTKKAVAFLLTAFLVCMMTVSAKAENIYAADTKGVSAIFGGGPFVTGGQSVINDLKSSGFNTIMIWSAHPNMDGTLYLNDILVCKDGEYVGKSEWRDQWHSLKTGNTSVTRVEISVGAAGCRDFENIRDLIKKDGTGSNTVLYRNFAALIEATGADAVDFDDESAYDSDSMIKFGKMCVNMGAKVTLCPYTRSSFWKTVKNGLGSSVDRIYLQCYDGGASNNPSTWKSTMGMDVIPGLWCIHNSYSGTSASSVKSKMTSWKSSSVGGFIWLYDDLMKLSSPNSTADYANAINSVFGNSGSGTTPVITPTPGTYGNVALNKTATANQYVSGETPNKAIDGSVSAYGSGNSKWCSNSSSSAKWLAVDLGAEYTIDRWVVKHAGAGGESTSYNTRDFRLQMSKDGKTWTDVDVVSGNTLSTTDRTVTAFTARYVRLYITKPTQGSDVAARIYEFEVYGR